MPDKLDKQDGILTNKIDELESLLTQSGQDAAGLQIPILDDLVDAADYGDTDDLFALAEDDEPMIDELADRLEQKFYSELDEIVSILKTNMKENIKQELQEQLKHDPQKKRES